MGQFLHYLTLSYLWQGALVTLEVTGGAFIVGLLGGLIVAGIQLGKVRGLSQITRIFSLLLRGTPLLLQLLFVYDVLPVYGVTISALNTAILVLGLNTTTFFSEVFRGAVLSIDGGQTMAARSMGFTPWVTSRRVVAPQAVRIALPQLANQCVILILSSSLASTIAVTELTLRSETLSAATFQVIPVYMAASAMYLLMTSAVAALQVRLEATLDLTRARARGTADRGFVTRVGARFTSMIRTNTPAAFTGVARTATGPTAPDTAGLAGRAQLPARVDTSPDLSDEPNEAHVAQYVKGMAGSGAELPSGVPMLRVQGLTKRYRHDLAVDDLSLDVYPGQVVAVIGRSGCGKSTLLRSILRLESLNAGQIEVAGHPFGVDGEGRVMRGRALANARADAGIGMLFQHFELFPHMTALRNVMSGPLYVRNAGEGRAALIAQAGLSAVGLEHQGHKLPGHLSGGQQQRVAIARALALRPRLLLLDEPTSAIDAEMVQEVLEVLRGLADAGITMVIVTHELKFAEEVADRIVFMSDGKIVEEGAPSEILRKPAKQETAAFLRLLEPELSVDSQ